MSQTRGRMSSRQSWRGDAISSIASPFNQVKKYRAGTSINKRFVAFRRNGFNSIVGLTILGIDDSDTKTPAVVIVIVVIDHKVQSSINLSGKR